MLSAAKGMEQTTGMIFVVGILVVTLLTVGMGSSMFSAVNIPLDDTQSPDEQVELKLANYADRCWRKAGKGSSIERIDCFSVRLNGTEEVDEDAVKDLLQDLPDPRLNFSSDFFTDSRIESKVSYRPETRSVNVSKVRDLR